MSKAEDLAPLKTFLHNSLHPLTTEAVDLLSSPQYLPVLYRQPPTNVLPLPMPPMSIEFLQTLLKSYASFLRPPSFLYPHVMPPPLAQPKISPLKHAMSEMKPPERENFTFWFSPNGFP